MLTTTYAHLFPPVVDTNYLEQNVSKLKAITLVTVLLKARHSGNSHPIYVLLYFKKGNKLLENNVSKTGSVSVFRLLYSVTLNIGRWTKSRNPAILSVVHRPQNHFDSRK
jgi:hypothetical protein